MAMLAVERSALHNALRSAAGQIAGMIRDLPDTGVALPGARWTVGDAAAHLAHAKGLAARICAGEMLRYGDGTVAGLAPANEGFLTEYAERNGRVLADLLVENTESFIRVASELPEDAILPMFLGPMSPAVTESYMLTHLLMHGSAIAKALRKPYPIDAELVELALPFLRASVPLFVNEQEAAGLTARFEIRLRRGSRLTVRFDEGKASVEERPAGRVDCHISADPVAFLLLAAGIEGQWGLIARGKLMTWGRKPWLALKLTKVIVAP
ncbi:MAG: maleylpyruvate isomerase family mycothiol-dependent enzyme [Actinomycetota bacterium]|nr:maleylpyruvate isomerase family mycothiol-dependent enzyme [Actinomycetota bacterium]